MKLTTRDIVFLYDTVAKIANKQDIERAPIDVKFLLVRNIRAMQPIYQEFIDARKKLLLENSTEIEGTADRRATAEQAVYINNEIEKLEAVEVEIPISSISLSKLEALNLDVVELSGLYPIIANEEA